MIRKSPFRVGRNVVWATASVAIALAVVVLTTSSAGAATPGAATVVSPQKSGTLTLTQTSGSISGTLGLGVSAAAGSGAQVCDPADTSFAVVYAAIPGDEYGVAGESVDYTILAPEDGSMVPAGGTLAQFLPTIVDPVFPATGGNSVIDQTTDGTYSLGVRCQDDSSTRIFQNYWTTITVDDGNWTLGGAGPTTSPSTTSPSTTSSSGSGTTGPVTTDPGTTSSTPTSGDPTSARSGTLVISPNSGNLLSGTHSFSAIPATGSGAQPCGAVQAFALLYFTPVGDEYAAAGDPGVVFKSRPLQAAGLDIPRHGTLVDFLSSVGSVDFSQSLGAVESWGQSLAAGTYSLGVRCQSGTAGDPTIYQNYFSTVDVAADGTWHSAGASGTTTPTTTAASTTAGAALTLAVLDATGHQLSSPITVKQGQPLFVSADGFAQTENVVVVVHSTPITLATVHALGGGIAAQITIPATLAPGVHLLTFTGSSSGRSGSLSITVTRAQVGTASSSSAGSTTASSVGSTAGTPSSGDPASTSSRNSTVAQNASSTSTFVPYPSSSSSSDAATPPAGDRGADANALAYTGFPADDSIDLGILLLGFGIVILALVAGFRTDARAPVGIRPRGGAHDVSRGDVGTTGRPRT